MHIHMHTCDYMRLHATTCDYMRLHATTCDYMRLLYIHASLYTNIIHPHKYDKYDIDTSIRMRCRSLSSFSAVRHQRQLHLPRAKSPRCWRPAIWKPQDAILAQQWRQASTNSEEWTRHDKNGFSASLIPLLEVWCPSARVGTEGWDFGPTT